MEKAELPRSSFLFRKNNGLLYTDMPTNDEILNCQCQSVYTKENVTCMPDIGSSPYQDNAAGVRKFHENIKAHNSLRSDDQ